MLQKINDRLNPSCAHTEMRQCHSCQEPLIDFPLDFHSCHRKRFLTPFLSSDFTSRAQILAYHLKRELGNSNGIKLELQRTDLKQLAEQTEGFSGAELRAIIGEVIRRAIQKKLRENSTSTISMQDFQNVLNVYAPPEDQRTRYKQMEDWALAEVSFLDTIPEQYRSRLRSTDPKNSDGTKHQ